MAGETKDTSFVADLAKVQAAISVIDIKKDAKGNFGKYITLDAIHKAALPILSKNNLAWATMPTYDESGEPVLEYKLLHTSGEKIEGRMRIYIDKNTAQGQGSAITYARRYSICAVVGITADDDDDGAAASKTVAPPYKNKVVAPVEPAPELPLTVEQISELVTLVKRQNGFTTKDECISFLNLQTELDSFTKVPRSDFDAFKKSVISAGIANSNQEDN